MCSTGGSEVQIAGSLHCDLVSSVPVLGEEVREVGTEEGEVICSCESKDEMGKEWRQNSQISFSLGFYGGQWKSSLFLFHPALTIAFLAGWSISVVWACTRQHILAWICILEDLQDLLYRLPRPSLLHHTLSLKGFQSTHGRIAAFWGFMTEIALIVEAVCWSCLVAEELLAAGSVHFCCHCRYCAQ